LPAVNLRKQARKARVRVTYPALRAVGNIGAERRFTTNEPSLSPVQRGLVETLRHDGIATTTFDELVGDRALWSELSEDMQGFATEAEELASRRSGAPQAKGEYLIRRLRRRAKQGEELRFEENDPWLRLGASGAILDVVNSYRGMWTKFVDMDQWYTVPFGGDRARIASQNWHRDPEDLHVIKVFVYFNDVDEEAGPFQYVPGSPEGMRYGDLWPWHMTAKNYPPGDEFARKIPETEYRSAVGDAGTIIFCDTSGFHRGGFARSKARLLSYFTYVSPAAARAGRALRSFAVSRSQNGALPDRSKFALD
jgi:hypothetical protein